MPFQESAIETSLFDLFKSGPGPSSSHTMGPMKAACDFRERCARLAPRLTAREVRKVRRVREDGPESPERTDGPTPRFRVRLYGSLSATGAGHGTNAAVLAGLLGYQPAQCPPGLLRSLAADAHAVHSVRLESLDALASLDAIEHADIVHQFPYSNTLRISLETPDAVLAEEEYYSVGGGFIQCKHPGSGPETRRGEPAHPYSSMRQLKTALRVTGLTLHELMLENESAITGLGRAVILDELEKLLETMLQSVRRGLDAEGPLPGSLGVQRKARDLYQKSKALPLRADRFIGNLNAYAMAAAEENADGGVIVTAPTCGAAGVMPALLYAMRHDLTIGDRALREGLLAAAAIAFLAKHNAAIAGAEVGCQGEVGVASAMAAAMVAHARGASAQTTENAAEIALEHHLGLTCDPVGGYVQIPCIERNAMGAVKAYNAYLLASLENPFHHRVSLDSAIAAMAETGRDMNAKFKETSLGGLAVSMVNC